jgi:hypothetical protein
MSGVLPGALLWRERSGARDGLVEKAASFG